MKSKLLIVGKTPPPIGGVTIHVNRLLTQLKLSKFPYTFISLTKKNILLYILKVASYKIVHIHSSDPFVRLFLVVFAKLWAVTTVVTIHGNIGRFKSTLRNLADKWTIKLASTPLVLNTNSMVEAVRWNSNSKLVSAFIPPILETEYLNDDDVVRIKKMVDTHVKTFCTNAYNKSFDKNDVEIYGIYELIQAFTAFPAYALIISDPSGIYLKEISEEGNPIPDNILFISGLHSFYKVMTLVHASIRNTITDGDSLSVKESLYLNKQTYATDVVERPQGCLIYKRGQFRNILNNPLTELVSEKDVANFNGYPELIEIYNSYLN